MSEYQNILVATDLMPESKHVVVKAAKVAKRNGARLTLLHIVEQIPAYAYGFMGAPSIEEELSTEATKQLALLAEELALTKVDQKVEIGPTKTHILNVADEIKADLIIVGSHGRHGLQRILGSTAAAVLHGAECDVLTVRYQD